MSARPFRLSALALCCWALAVPSTARANSLRNQLAQVEHLIDSWQVQEAAKQLEPLLHLPVASPRVLQLQGEVLFLRGDYAGALQLLDEAARHSRHSPQLKMLRELIAATAETVKGYVSQRSRGSHFEIWAARGKDELLLPFAAEALEAMRIAMQHDLGYAPPETVRVEIYPVPEDLARVSPLTRAEIDRSGTVALCKYNRLMIVSPRALLRGYGWLDALAHEYVHLVVSQLSYDTVPIWLHEGLAKFFEARWRLPAGSASVLSPAQEHLLANALRTGKFVSWEQMHPSMAKLPDQETTALAFAQVHTVVEFLAGKVALEGLRRVIKLARSGTSSWEAVRVVSGLAAAPFQRSWKQYLRGRELRPLADLVPLPLRFGKAPTAEQELAELKEARARRHLRLAELLRTRRLTRAAVIEYEKARSILGERNDLVANHLARAYLEMASPAQAISALLPVVEYYPELAGPQVTLGLAYLRHNEPARAEEHLKVALRINPFNPEVHCYLAEALQSHAEEEAQRYGALCTKLQ